MPPDSLPPLAPFPPIAPTPADEPVKGAAPALLSEEQRADFAFAAGLLEGKGPLEFQPPPPEPHAGGAFLLTPEDDPAPSAATAGVPPMPPVKPRDLLDEDDEPVSGVLSAEDGWSLQNLGAALSKEKRESVSGIEPGDLGPFELLAPLVKTAPVPLPAALEPPPEETKMPAFSLLGLAAPAAEKPVPVAGEKPAPPPEPDKPESKPALVIFPPPEKEAPPAPAEPQPVSFPPPRPVVEDDADDLVFDAPLLFPVPSALPDAERQHPPQAATEPAAADGGLGAMLAGALLIAAGIFLVSRVPSLAGEADAASASILTRAALLRGEMFLSAVAGAFCLLMGIGAATLRRWAPPIIHATGWVVLLTALIGLGVGTAALFHFAGNETTGDASPSDGTALFAGVGIAGVALPLLLIAIFQRPALARLCAAADKHERWTDRTTIPALMVVFTGLLLSTAACALCLAHARFPLFADWELKHAPLFWSVAAVVSLAGAALTAAGKRSGWSVLLLLVLGIGSALYITSAGKGWETLLPGVHPAPGSTAGALIAASSLLPSLLILLMTRKSLAPPSAD